MEGYRALNDISISYHFNTEDCLDVHSALAPQFGMKKRRQLRSGAIPTIFHRPSTAQGAAETGESQAKGQFQWLLMRDLK